MPEDYKAPSPDVPEERDIVDEIIEQEILDGMEEDRELTDEEVEESMAEELVEQTVLDDMADSGEVARICDMCGKELDYIDQYDAWYCYDCEKYEGE